MTQWIFKENRCNCTASAVEADRLDSQDSELNAREELIHEPEIQINIQNLPLNHQNFPISRYTPIRVLGAGVSGTVYLASDHLLDKSVAIKVLHQVSGEQLLQFQEEARITSKLNHQSIIKILDFGPTERGEPYMVLEYVENAVSLAQYIGLNGPLSNAMSVEIFQKVADALAYAHELGIFHRDLKPSNILLTDTRPGQASVKLIDFGIARIKQLQEPTLNQGVTLAGTPEYMAHDMAAGHKFDALSEIYSFGCVLFDALTGGPPFAGRTNLEVIAMHSNSPIPTLSERSNKEFPDSLERIVAKCLAKERTDRFDSVAALREELAAVELELQLHKADKQTVDHSLDSRSINNESHNEQNDTRSGDIDNVRSPAWWKSSKSLHLFGLVIAGTCLFVVQTTLLPFWSTTKERLPRSSNSAQALSQSKKELEQLDQQVLAERLQWSGLMEKGQVAVQMGDYNHAKQLLEQALDEAERSRPQDKKKLIRSLNALGELNRVCQDFKQSESFYNLALKVDSSPDDLSFKATIVNNQALLYQTIGDLKKSEVLFKRALEMEKKAVGSEHPKVATILQNFSELYTIQGELKKAVALLEQSLAIRMKTLGPNHPEVAMSLSGLAGRYREMGDNKRAARLFGSSLEIREKTLGRNDPEITRTLYQLGATYRNLGDYQQAERFCMRAASTAAYPGDAATSYHVLGGIYILQHKYELAEKALLRALEERRSVPNPGGDESFIQQRDVAISLGELARFYQTTGKLEKARSFYIQSIKVWETVRTIDRDMIVSLLNYSTLLRKMNRDKEANQIAQEASELAKQIGEVQSTTYRD